MFSPLLKVTDGLLVDQESQQRLKCHRGFHDQAGLRDIAECFEGEGVVPKLFLVGLQDRRRGSSQDFGSASGRGYAGFDRGLAKASRSATSMRH